MNIIFIILAIIISIISIIISIVSLVQNGKNKKELFNQKKNFKSFTERYELAINRLEVLERKADIAKNDIDSLYSRISALMKDLE